MITVSLFAQTFGVLFLIIGLAMIIHREYYTSLLEEAGKSKLFPFFGAIFAILVGTGILHFQNSWQWEWPVLITIIGWAGVLKGTFFLLCPRGTMSLMENIIRIPYLLLFGGFICVILGGVLISFGW